jgi:hypothetical protein
MAAPPAARSSYSGAGLGARDHRLHGALAQHAGLARNALFLAVQITTSSCTEARGEDQLGVRQALAQHVVLIDRQIIVVARVHLHRPDPSALDFSSGARPSYACRCGSARR